MGGSAYFVHLTLYRFPIHKGAVSLECDHTTDEHRVANEYRVAAEIGMLKTSWPAGRRGEPMRMHTVLSVYVLFIIVGLVFAAFMVQNVEPAEIVLFGHAYAANLALVIAGAAAVGFALAVLLLLPSRIAVGLYSRALFREAFQLERRLAMLMDQRDQWLDEHEHFQQEQEHMLDEREYLLQQYHQVLSERDRLLSEHNRLLMEHHSALVRLAASDAASLRVIQPEGTFPTSAAVPAAAATAAAPAATLPSDYAKSTASHDVVAGIARAAGISRKDAPTSAAPTAAQYVYP